MRRIRKVHIVVSSNFYDILDKQRSQISSKINSKIGFNKQLSFLSFTEMLAQKARENGGNIVQKKQKRRCF